MGPWACTWYCQSLESAINLTLEWKQEIESYCWHGEYEDLGSELNKDIKFNNGADSLNSTYADSC